MKQRYARLDTSKLPGEVKTRFSVIADKTRNFEDEDVLDIWEKPFDTLYEIVESKYPGAIKKGGVVKKERPAKVKKAGPKKTEKEKIAEAIEKHEPTPAMKKKLSDAEIEQIEDIFQKTTSLNDEGLQMILVATVGLSEAQAKKWVAYRDKYLKGIGKSGKKYSERKTEKKESRKKSDKNIVKTRDGHEFNRKDPGMKGKKFFDESGKEWTCKGYNLKLDECVFTDDSGKEITSCLKDMYVNNPVKKREKGDLVDECRETLREAGYTVREHKTGSKRVSRKEPRPEKEIIKERVESTFTPITKDLESSKEKKTENKEVIDVLDRIQKLLVRVLNRVSNLADDGKAEKLGKIEKLLNELVEE